MDDNNRNADDEDDLQFMHNKFRIQSIDLLFCFNYLYVRMNNTELILDENCVPKKR